MSIIESADTNGKVDKNLKKAIKRGYIRYIHRRGSSGNWFLFYRDYLKVMSRDAALFLQAVLNLSSRRPKNEYLLGIRRKGWLLATVDYIEKTLEMSKETQDRVVEELQGYIREPGKRNKTDRKPIKERVFIKVGRFGVPARRHFKINLLRVEKAIVKEKIARRIGGNPPITRRGEAPDLVRGGGLDTSRGKTPDLIYKEKGRIKETKNISRPEIRGDGVRFGNPPDQTLSLDLDHQVKLPFHQEVADKLFKALYTASKLTRHYRKVPLVAWGKYFLELEKVRTKDQISVILDWYSQNIGKEYIPQAYSAQSFCHKFANLEDARKRQLSSSDQTTNPPADLVISPEAQRLYEVIRELPWPKGSREQLLPVIQISLNNYKKYLQTNRKLLKHDNYGVKSLADRFNTLYTAHTNFILQWFYRYNDSVKNWSGWSGKVNPFSPNIKFFDKLGKEWTQDYVGQTNALRRWTEYYAALQEVLANENN